MQAKSPCGASLTRRIDDLAADMQSVWDASHSLASILRLKELRTFVVQCLLWKDTVCTNERQLKYVSCNTTMWIIEDFVTDVWRFSGRKSDGILHFQVSNIRSKLAIASSRSCLDAFKALIEQSLEYIFP